MESPYPLWNASASFGIAICATHLPAAKKRVSAYCLSRNEQGRTKDERKEEEVETARDDATQAEAAIAKRVKQGWLSLSLSQVAAALSSPPSSSSPSPPDSQPRKLSPAPEQRNKRNQFRCTAQATQRQTRQNEEKRRRRKWGRRPGALDTRIYENLLNW